MKARKYRVTFRPEDIACTPPCGMEATLKTIDETIRSILSRYADESGGDRLRFGQNDVEIKNGFVEIQQNNEEDTEKIAAILKHYFRVHETAE
ncbi:MAG TPA: hypothetical protein VMW67_02855 [Desulfobacteria bacterium]|nr:hypothetical protein [Desulfobacteria bacterium]